MSRLTWFGALAASIALNAQRRVKHTVAGRPTTVAREAVPARSARFYNIRGLARDRSGDLYVADTENI